MKKFEPCLVLCFLLFFWTGVFNARSMDQPFLGRDDFPILVKGDHDYPPYEYINEKGEPDGFNVELFHKLAAELNLDYQLEVGPWSQVRKELENGSIDVLMGMMYSPERAEVIRFGVPHSFMAHGIFTHKDSLITSVSDLSGKEVVVQKGDRMHDFVMEKGLTDQIILTSSQREALQLINEGYHHGALIGTYQGLHHIRKQDLQNVVLKATDIEPQKYSLAVSYENKELLDLLNMALFQLKASGEYDELYQKWFSVYEQYRFWDQYRYIFLFSGLFVLLLVVFVILLRYRIGVVTRNLKKSEEKYRLLVNNQKDLIVKVNPEGKFLFVSPSYCDLFGKEEKTLLGSHYMPLVHEDDRETTAKAMEALYYPPYKIYVEQRAMTRHGWRWLSWSDTAVLDENGSVKEIIGIGQDITIRKRAEEALRESEEKFSLIFRAAPMWISLNELKTGRFIDVNDAFSKITGFEREEVIGKTPLELAITNEESGQALFEKIQKSGKLHSLQMQLGTKQGQAITCILNSELISIKGKEYLLTIVEDITQRIKTEELKYNLELARKTTQIKQTFLSNMSHEMRTPLNGIIGFTNFLSRTSLNAEQQEYLKIITQSSKTLLGLINEVLDLSKIESGEMPISLEKINTRSFKNKLLDTYTISFREKNLKFLLSVSPDFPEWFVFDPQRLDQIMTNLIGNALKFTEEGEINVVFEKISAHQNKDELKISVIDTGMGISPDHQEAIFQEFVQIQDIAGKYTSGTGLGLPISKKIVEKLGGNMGVKSDPGKGSTFWFTMELFSTHNIEPEKKSPSLEKIPLDLSVLVVEDKEINRKVAEMFLKEMGCKVEMAENGLVGYEKVMENHFDIVLMDIQMPVMDGVTAMQELKETGLPLPVIIGLSAAALEGDAEKYISMGMDDYITKPVDTEILYQKMKYWKKKAMEKN